MKIGRILVHIATFPMILTLLGHAVLAADITVHEGLKRIVLEGRIEQGDYERLLNKILEKGTRYRTIYLASNGGSVVEAIKIGQLIRQLNYSTELGVRLGEKSDKTVCYAGIAERNCVCASACALVYLGGVERTGDALSVHRVYVEHETLKTLTMKEAELLSHKFNEATELYLKKMKAPPSFVEMMQSASSDRAVNPSKEYVAANLSGYIKGYDEFLIAKCGSSELAFRRYLKSQGSESELNKYHDVRHCMSEEVRDEVDRNYFRAINAAIDKSEDAFIPQGSLLAYLKHHRVRDLSDLIGRKSSDAVRLLALFGIGDSYKDIKDLTLFDQSIVFDGKIGVLFAQDSVADLNLHFFESDNRKDFKGHFLGTLTSNSTPSDFISAIGDPLETGCIYTAVCVLYFDTDKFSATVYFNAEPKTVRAINMMRSGDNKELLKRAKDRK